MPGRDPVQVGKEIYESLGTPIIQSLERYGVTLDKLSKQIAEGMDATDTKSFQYKGSVIESPDKIAWETRRAFIDMALKLRSLYPSERHHVTVEAVPVPDLPLSDEEKVELEARKQIIKERALKEAMKK